MDATVTKQNIPDQAVSWKPVIQTIQLEISSYVHNTTIYENKQNIIALHNIANIKVPISQWIFLHLHYPLQCGP